MAVISADKAREQRTREVENALASVRMEGLEPSEQTTVLFQRYVDGGLTSDELDRAFAACLDHEYGPACLRQSERFSER